MLAAGEPTGNRLGEVTANVAPDAAASESAVPGEQSVGVHNPTDEQSAVPGEQSVVVDNQSDDQSAGVDEQPGPSRRRRAWRWAARGLALITLIITVMLIALAIGMRANDAAIDEHLGTATATVLSLTPLSTGIEFVDATGTTIRPEGGVLYPGLLSIGQQFVVEYSTQNPQIARVAGRTASVGNVPIGICAGVTYLIAVPLIWWCHRRSGLPLVGSAARSGTRRTATWAEGYLSAAGAR